MQKSDKCIILLRTGDYNQHQVLFANIWKMGSEQNHTDGETTKEYRPHREEDRREPRNIFPEQARLSGPDNQLITFHVLSSYHQVQKHLSIS